MKHSHVFMRFPGGLSKALSFTFDDGSEQDERLVALLAENGLLATFNLNMGLLPPDDSFDFSTLDRAVFPAADWCQRRMSCAKIGRVFAESGMELACHGYLHADLSKLDDEGVLWEIMRDRAALEELTGESVRGFAYPQGAYDGRIAGLVRSAGFEYARAVGSTHGFDLPRDMTAWRPSCHYAEDEVPELCERFISAEPETGIYFPGVEAKLFTVFAHSYEFEHRGDWGRMEDIARTLGGRSDIWYCTFIGYCRYAKAFESLDFNLERTWVRNPSALDVWVFANGNTVCVPAGGCAQL